jgi:hypothetical protein
MGHGPSKPTAADLVHNNAEHIHGNQHVYPTLADGVTVATHATDWVLGTITEIVPVDTITEDFDIHEVLFEDVSIQDKTFEIVIYYGATDIEAGRLRVSSAVLKGSIPNGTMMTPIIPANSKVSAAIAVQDGGAKEAIVSIRYHLY